MLVLWHVANSVVRRLSYVQVVQCVCGVCLRSDRATAEQSSGMLVQCAEQWCSRAEQWHVGAVRRAVVQQSSGAAEQSSENLFLPVRIGDG